MSVHVLCLTSAGGLPVFTRKRGDGDTLPYSIVGSLNGLHMFSKSHNVLMEHTSTQDHNVVWKEFQDSIVLIGVCSGSTIVVIGNLLQSIFNAMVLIVGIDELKAQRNIERLKRDLRTCYPVFDKLLDAIDYGDSSSHSSDLVMLTESILCSENHLIQIVLESYGECLDTMFTCVLIHGKIAVATESWWSLHPDERKLLSLLGSVDYETTSKEVPVFLPYKSPNAAFRLVSCTLIPDVIVCSLCGPNPPLKEIEQVACQCFKATLEILKSAQEIHPRNFPHSVHLDSGILGFLLINIPNGKYVLSRNPQNNSGKRSSGGSHRLDILRTFYYQAVSNCLIPKPNQPNESCTETYWCSEYHKCHAARISDNILCVLYSSSITTHAMRLLTQKTLKLLISDKQLCW